MKLLAEISAAVQNQNSTDEIKSGRKLNFT